jgi:glycosyltransferase involved in cell wall biosynthesis
MDDPWDEVARAGDWLLELERRTTPDVVHLNGYCHAALPFRRPVVVVAHSCVISWWRSVLHEDAPPRYDRYRREVRLGLDRADVVVAPTRAMLDDLRRAHGDVERPLVIANACDPIAGAPPSERDDVVLAAGRLWDEAKNIRALAKIAQDLPWPVYVAGNDVHPDGTRRGFAGVRMLGTLSHDAMGAWMSRASIFAMPVRYEPFGLAQLEAATRGAALVLGDIPSQREVWGDAAAFVPPDDADALFEAIAGLIGNPERRRALAQQGAARAAQYGPARMADEYVALYRRLVTCWMDRSAAREDEALPGRLPSCA